VREATTFAKGSVGAALRRAAATSTVVSRQRPVAPPASRLRAGRRATGGQDGNAAAALVAGPHAPAGPATQTQETTNPALDRRGRRDERPRAGHTRRARPHLLAVWHKHRREVRDSAHGLFCVACYDAETTPTPIELKDGYGVSSYLPSQPKRLSGGAYASLGIAQDGTAPVG
jgi:hypothetical protein